MIPKGATHQCHVGEYWDFDAFPIPMVWRDGKWVKDDSNWARIWIKLEYVDENKTKPKEN